MVCACLFRVVRKRSDHILNWEYIYNRDKEHRLGQSHFRETEKQREGAMRERLMGERMSGEISLVCIAYTVDQHVHDGLWHEVPDGLVDDVHVGVDQVTDDLHLSLQLWVCEEAVRISIRLSIHLGIGETRWSREYWATHTALLCYMVYSAAWCNVQPCLLSNTAASLMLIQMCEVIRTGPDFFCHLL